MLDVICKTNFSKINDKFDPKLLKAGILYNSTGEAIDKILFYEKMGCAKEVWNDVQYSLAKDSKYYIDDIVYIGDLFISYFGYNKLNLMQLYMGYKMFLNDTSYLYKHLNEFGMIKKEIGYKGKEEIVPEIFSNNAVRQTIFSQLIKIINYADINKHEKKIESNTK